MSSKVTLDRETFKALASETRLQVLHALDERRKTGSELARELDLNKATIHEHLGILEATGLVQKKDEGRKWVYWELTWEGSKLLHPGQGAVFSVLLALSVLSTGGAVAALGSAFGWWLGGGPSNDDLAFAPEADDAEQTSAYDASEAPTEGLEMQKAGEDGGFFDDGGGLFVMLLVTAIAAIAMAVWLRRRK